MRQDRILERSKMQQDSIRLEMKLIWRRLSVLHCRMREWNPQMQPIQRETPQADYLLSVPLIIAVVLCLGYMSLELFLV